ncbi:MAG: CheC, inhibitor of methylation [Verrucomicrobiales bacterium]|nr:CheC, inhibitor of methylation [Verrucomicrobiales bacterium]
MQLTASQTDAVTELINIGYARAAGALSDLTGHRIVLQVPRVAIHPIQEVATVLSADLQGEVASVHQVFSGPVAGNALLLMDQAGARMLNDLLTNETSLNNSLDGGAREVLTEVGNIVLNACLGVFGNLLHVQVSFAVPRLHVDSIETVLNSITVNSVELQYALTIQTKFFIRQGNVSGYLVIILGITSLSALLRELESWEKRQLEF